MLTKNMPVRVKAAAGDAGEFEAVVAVYGNVDSYNDVIVKGAFADTLAEWSAKGDPIPVVWSHDSNDPFSHIGHVVEASETDTGLQVKAQLDMDNPKAVQVFKLLKARRVTQFSFAYSVEDSGPIEVDGVKATELRALKLFEVGPTLVGANQSTELLSAKSDLLGAADGVKAGRVLSAKNTAVVTKAIDALENAKLALSALLDAATNDEGKTSTGHQVKDEELSAVKGDKPEELGKVKPEEPAAEVSVDLKSWEHFQKSIELEELL